MYEGFKHSTDPVEHPSVSWIHNFRTSPQSTAVRHSQFAAGMLPSRQTTPNNFPSCSGGTSDDFWRYIPWQLNWIDHRLHQASSVEVHQSRTTSFVQLKSTWIMSKDHRVHMRFQIKSCSSYTQLVGRAGSILQTNDTLDTTETYDKFLQAPSDLRSIQILHSWSPLFLTD